MYLAILSVTLCFEILIMSLLHRRFISLVSFVLLLSSSTFTAFAYSPLEALPQGSRVGLLVKPLGSEHIFQQTDNLGLYFPPASTLKLVTALAAKLELGDQYRFSTTLTHSGNDIIIRFSGDPTLTNQDLKNLLTTLKKQGLSRISGDLWLDNSTFSGYDRAVGSPWDILGVCYSAPSTAITLDGNCVQASIYTQDDGKTRVYVPEQYPIHVTTNAQTVSKLEQESTRCDLELTTSEQNNYQLNGCLAERSKPLPLKFAVQDPNLYTTRMIYKQLKQVGISLEGEVKVGRYHTEKGRVIAKHQSQPLEVLLEIMLKESDNLIADSLTKTLGRHFFIQPGSFNNGTEAIKQIIFSRTGVNLEHAQLADGSGLSRNNRLSIDSMANILNYIWKHDHTLGLIAIMPKAGESGTLRYRSSMRGQDVKGQLVAKSGSLYGSYNMAGFGLDKQGKPSTLFVQFVTDYYPNNRSSQPNVTAPITQFETLFFQDVVKFSQLNPKK